MESLRGTCSSCHHSFRLRGPSAEGAKCPKCGGAVVIAGPEVGAQAPGPARSTRPARAATEANPTTSRASRTARPVAEQKGPARLPLIAGAGVVIVALAIWFFRSRGAKEVATTEAAEAVAMIDLSQLADQKPLEGTTDEDWAALNELMTRYRTPPFGATSVQSGDRLMIKGKRAVPAILNGFKRLDLTTPEGAEIGWKIQTLLLQGLCNDTNFGWRRETRPADVAFNQQVIQRWFRAWEVAGENDEIWAEIARLKDIPPGRTKAPAATEPPTAGEDG